MAAKEYNFSEGNSELSKGKLQPFYSLAGEENYFRDKLLDRITSRVFQNPGMKGFNFYRFFGNEHSLADVVSASLSMPMPGSDKLIIVKDFEKLKIPNEADFEKFLKSPAQGNITVFCYDSLEKTELNKLLKAHTQIINCVSPKDYQIPGWAKEYCSGIGYTIDADAAQFLADQVGVHLLILEQEIIKVISFKTEDKKISIDDIALTLGVSKEFTLFNLQDMLGQKKLGESLVILKKLLESGQQEPAILGALISFYKRLHSIKVLNQAGQNAKQAASTLKMNEYAVQKIFPHIGNYNFEEIVKIYRYFREADIELKTSQGNKNSVMHRLFHRICNN